MSDCPIEIERKYLIAYPDTDLLRQTDGVRIWDITQTYLLAEAGVTARVRRIAEEDTVRFVYTAEEDTVRFVYTAKRRISDLSAFEEERDLTYAEYEAYLLRADPARNSVRKTRYKIPGGEIVWEIDVYPFWSDRAILEIELPDEKTEAPLPPFVTIYRDVSGDKRYKNASLAKSIPVDVIDME